MIHKEEDLIEFPKKLLIVMIAFMALFFLLMNRAINERAKSVDYLQYHEAMDTTYVVRPVNDRGWLFYEGNDYKHAVSSNAVLVENKYGYDGWKFISKSNPSFHRLSSLPGPYHMYKAAYSDTIVVIKDGFLMKFKMPVPDSVYSSKHRAKAK
ncbi:MAG: hypothetical protein F083_2119 [bacterium F083]|nr:MAG: hypothetical protein F083_2119 [bacterium F083]